MKGNIAIGMGGNYRVFNIPSDGLAPRLSGLVFQNASSKVMAQFLN